MSKLPPSVLDEPLLSDQEHEVEINVESGKSPNRKAEFLSQVTNKSRSSIRARLFAVLLLHLLDVSSAITIGIYAYGGEWSKLWNLDYMDCKTTLAIVDLIILSTCRMVLFSLLFVVLARHMVPVATAGIFLGIASLLWSVIKGYFLLTSKPCSVDGNIETRQQSLVLAQVSVGTVFCLLDTIAASWIRSEIRNKQALEHVLFHVSTYASAYTSMQGIPGSMMRTESDPNQQSNTSQLFSLAKKQRIWLFAGCCALLVRLPFSLSLPHFVSEIIGALLDKDAEAVKANIILFIIAGCVDAFLDFWCVFLFGYTQQRIIRSLRVDLFRSILNQDIAFFDTTPTGEISSRLSSDCAEMANDLTWCPPEAVRPAFLAPTPPRRAAPLPLPSVASPLPFPPPLRSAAPRWPKPAAAGCFASRSRRWCASAASPPTCSTAAGASPPSPAS